MSISSFKDMFWIFVPAALLIAGAFWATFQFVEPAPPKTISISTGSSKGAYYAFGNQYAKILKQSGITLQVHSSAGSVENVQRLSDVSTKFNLALVQGGISNSTKSPELMSLGRVFLEPLWVFYRQGEFIDRLTDLKQKRIAIGPSNSGTRQLASTLLKANGVTSENAAFIKLSGQNAIKALEENKVDAVFLVLAPKSEFIRKLLLNKNLQLMNFSRAEAYTRNFSYLSKITLPQGAIDFVENIPSKDVSLVATSAALVARSDLHPALAGLFVQALKEVHSKGDMFQQIGEFPKASDPEYIVTSDTERSHASGVPFLQRYLPFWLASFLQRSFLLLLPIATILFPVVKLAPLLYNWKIRSRILHWYKQLKNLEKKINLDTDNDQLAAHKNEIENIESAVQGIPVPIDFADQFYHLRGAVSLVRKRLLAQENKNMKNPT